MARKKCKSCINTLRICIFTLPYFIGNSRLTFVNSNSQFQTPNWIGFLRFNVLLGLQQQLHVRRSLFVLCAVSNVWLRIELLKNNCLAGWNPIRLYTGIATCHFNLLYNYHCMGFWTATWPATFLGGISFGVRLTKL